MAYDIEAMALPFTLALGLSVLVFSKTAEYRHESIPDGLGALEAIAEKHGFQIRTTEDGASFTDENLEGFDVVVFLMTTGDVLDESQQAAFERFIQSGKGYVGVHAAADTEYEWSWYGDLVGAYFASHPPVQEATYVVEQPDHPATRMFDARFRRVDEHYSFDRNPRPKVEVLVTLDESSYEPGEHPMGDHPVVWHHDYDGGRAFYTALGHTKAAYSEPRFRDHLAAAIVWAAGTTEPMP